VLYVTTGLSAGQRMDVLLGVIVHNKALGSSNRSRHHHRHKRSHHTSHSHDYMHQQHKKLKMQVGVGSVTPPDIGSESPKKSLSTTSTPTFADNEVASTKVPSTNITHFSAGLNNEVLSSASVRLNSNDGAKDSTNNVSDDGAYSPSDNVEKSTTTASDTDTLTTTTTLTTTDTVITPALSPNTMSRLQSLIETVKESIAAMPSSVKQDEPAPSEEPPPPSVKKEEEDENTTKSAYVFHETLPPNITVPVTTVTMTSTASTVVNQQSVSSFYGNPDVHSQKTSYGSAAAAAHHGFQEPRRRWSPYKGKWSPNGR